MFPCRYNGFQQAAARAAERVGFTSLKIEALNEVAGLFRLSANELNKRVAELQRVSSDPALGVSLQRGRRVGSSEEAQGAQMEVPPPALSSVALAGRLPLREFAEFSVDVAASLAWWCPRRVVGCCGGGAW